MAQPRPRWWIELLTALATIYVMWDVSHPAGTSDAAWWFHMHRAAWRARGAAERFERYAHEQYLKSVMH